MIEQFGSKLDGKLCKLFPSIGNFWEIYFDPRSVKSLYTVRKKKKNFGTIQFEKLNTYSSKNQKYSNTQEIAKTKTFGKSSNLCCLKKEPDLEKKMGYRVLKNKLALSDQHTCQRSVRAL